MGIKVVKIGGNVVDNPQLLEEFVRDFASMPGAKVLVHGGGVMATSLQKQLGIEPVLIDGRRVTDEDSLKVVTMVYAGWCNKSIVALLQKYGCNAVGLSGADGNLIEASKRPLVRRENADGSVYTIDYGYVGDVDTDKINSAFLMSLIADGITPVVCAITHDKRGNLLNTNADTIASSLAVALAGEGKNTTTLPGVSLIYCFEKDGVLYDANDDGSVIDKINPDYYAQLKSEERVSAGMIPKLDNSFDALRAGVSEVVIKHARNLLNDKGTVLSL